ncbi:MAG: DMT family transporter [Ruminococcaceae bacterium]|nr:DMT family transporter [Oscillospiraceae bacterium]
MKRNYAYAVATVFIWSTMAAVSKMLLNDIPNLQTLSISGVFAFLFLFAINAKSGKLGKMKEYRLKDYAVMAGLGFIGLFVYTALYYYGLTQLTSQEACILNYLWPVMLVIFSCIILKERLTVLKCVAMLCSFLGIVILSAGSSASAGGNAVLGIVSCIVAAACYGLFSVLNKKADYDQNIAMMIIWLVVAVCSAVPGFFAQDWVMLSGTQWLGMIWLGVVVDAVAYLMWALALRGAENTAQIANIAYLTPFLSLVVSAVLLKEQIQLRALAALVFIIGGILLQSLCEGAGRKRAE